ncbi:aspartate/glutamate racemase family protein [Breoghania sp. L-A4]|uniref:maleate cis-trans isomerase family protein n=1 Tax=Breoghania sp. L-A4 TaxID=2304600 RepID=UPI000E35F457|nr:aspartate/glutamate racemase family protein [Breoghania sp. L-A4]AXS41519.1 Asp/Glu/hydantoin racemase [Breoghania sp. L-A4]
MTSKKRHLLGMLTPSSNTILEPVTSAMLSGVEDTSAHFGRFRVTEISLGDAALGQFENEPMLAAADLLADALVGCICWNGTSAGWLGFERDEELCAAITGRTGIPACSSVLAINEIFERTGVKTFGMVTPYLDDVQQKIVENYGRAGYTCTAERHEGLKVNYAFSDVSEERIAEMVREVAAEGKPDAIIIFCTNLIGAPVLAELERELGIPIYDTVQTAVWKSMKVCGADPSRVTGWGRLFQDLD